MTRWRTTVFRLVPLVLAVLVLVGCSSGSDKDADAEPSGGASVSTAPPPPAPPRTGTCHDLTFEEATDPVDPGSSVPCGQPHTAVTFDVGRIAALADGHLLAVDSPTVRARLAKACPAGLADFVGGDETTFRLSRFETVWFGPSLEEADAGADSYRCDVVGLRSEGQLLELPRRMKGVLEGPDALATWGTCGTADPSARTFERVACSERHSWEAVDVVDLPPGARYLAKRVTATGDSQCQDVASERADGALKYTWSFEWPTRAQWAAGQRYGYCWVPAER